MHKGTTRLELLFETSRANTTREQFCDAPSSDTRGHGGGMSKPTAAVSAANATAASSADAFRTAMASNRAADGGPRATAAGAGNGVGTAGNDCLAAADLTAVEECAALRANAAGKAQFHNPLVAAVVIVVADTVPAPAELLVPDMPIIAESGAVP